MRVRFCPSDVKLKLFQEPGFDGLSSLMVRDDVGLLFIGARGKVVALSLDDISNKTREVGVWPGWTAKYQKCEGKRLYISKTWFGLFQDTWTASPTDTAACLMKGKSREVQCRTLTPGNIIRRPIWRKSSSSDRAVKTTSGCCTRWMMAACWCVEPRRSPLPAPTWYVPP